MKHKDPVTGRTATLIPWEVQNLFLAEVLLYPAILARENPSTMPYKNYTLDEWKWKAANHARFSGANRTVVLTAEQFHAMQRAMIDIIVSDPDDLGIFGSHYLVIEAKGIKLHTNCVIGENDLNPYEVLCQKVPYLDFEHYKKRENGQMVMDLGFGFHLTGVDDTPLVCLWDLAKVAQSYGAAGMQKGTIHHTNTMAGYGGRQSEMTQVRSFLVQICFRSTYGLHYEPVRRVRGGEISFCEDIDAYDTNAAFMKSCEDYIKMLNGGRSKSFGARDEVRGSGAAICEVLESLPSIVSLLIYPFTCDCQFTFEHKMKEYLKKSPFICIPSNTYFTFTKRRLRECQNVLLDLARHRPSNFGISIAILMHRILYIFNIVLSLYILLPHYLPSFRSLPLSLLSHLVNSGSYTIACSSPYSLSFSLPFSPFRLLPHIPSLHLFPTYRSVVSFAALKTLIYQYIYIYITFFHQCKRPPLRLPLLYLPPPNIILTSTYNILLPSYSLRLSHKLFEYPVRFDPLPVFLAHFHRQIPSLRYK
jgi:hypothetical protein